MKRVLSSALMAMSGFSSQVDHNLAGHFLMRRGGLVMVDGPSRVVSGVVLTALVAVGRGFIPT